MTIRFARAASVLAPFAAALTTAGLAQAAPVAFPVSSGGTGHSYEVIVNDDVNFDDARDLAEASGGYLVSITSPAEQSFVSSLLDSIDAPTGSYFMGLERIAGNNFGWTSGEPFSYESFADGEPNNFQNRENVGQIYWAQDIEDDINDRRGGWNDAPVSGYRNTTIPDLNRNGFVIERNNANAPGGGDNGGGNGGGTGGGDGDGGGGGDGGGIGGGDGGDGGGPPVAIPLPPALLAAPLAFVIAGLAARRRKV